MRVIQVLVPSGKREAIVELLEEEEIDFAVADEVGGDKYSDILFFAIEKENVEGILDELRNIGVDEEGYIVVSDSEAVISDKLEEEEEEDGDEEEEEKSGDRISREEIKARADDLSRATPNYVLFTVVSAIVAASGLLINSAAVVVGSMVIAPLIGPAMASSVGSVVSDDDMIRRGVKLQFLGMALAVGSATVFGFFVRGLVMPDIQLRLIEQIAERVYPGVLSLVIALGAGVAGALSLTSGVSAALVGVMIAVALIPPAATMGLGIAYFDWGMAIGSGTLLLINVLSINFATLITFWIKGYRPEHWFEEKAARRQTFMRIVVLAIVILVLSSFLVVSTYNARQNTEFENTVEDIARDAGVSLVSMDVHYSADLVFRKPQRVTLRVESQERGLAETMAERIKQKTGKDVEVVVVHEDVERVGSLRAG